MLQLITSLIFTVETPMTEQLISQEQLSRLRKVQDYLVKNIPCQDDMFWNKICEYKVLSDQTIRDVRVRMLDGYISIHLTSTKLPLLA